MSALRWFKPEIYGETTQLQRCWVPTVKHKCNCCFNIRSSLKRGNTKLAYCSIHCPARAGFAVFNASLKQRCVFIEQKDIIWSKHRGNKTTDAPQIIQKWFCFKYLTIMVKTPLSQEQNPFYFVYSARPEGNASLIRKSVFALMQDVNCQFMQHIHDTNNPVYPVRSNKHLISFITAALRCQSTSEKHHNTLSHLKIGRAAQGPCDFLCSREGQTLPLQSQWIFAGSLHFQPQYCPCLGDQEEYPLYVGSWSSSMLGPSLWNGEKAWKSRPPLITSF